MKKSLIMFAFILPSLFLQGQSTKPPSSAPKKLHTKEISPSKLPKSITNYISINLPSAKITKSMKQKRDPGAKYIVNVDIKTKHHTLVFNKGGELVKLDGKKIKTAKDR
jgi:hypothetical protein